MDGSLQTEPSESASKPLVAYDYSDYRDYLRDWFWRSKETVRQMSFRYLARRLKLRSPNHFHLVIEKQRHLSSATFTRVLEMLSLGERERLYLQIMFERDRSRVADQRAALEAQLERLRQTDNATLEPERYPILAQTLAWYIHMGAEVFHGLGPDAIAAKVLQAARFEVTKIEVHGALAALRDLGLMRLEGGVCHFDRGDVLTAWDVPHQDVKQHHRATLHMAQQAVAWRVDQRFFSSVTVACDDATYREVIQDVRDLCLRTLERAKQRSAAGSPCTQVVTLHASLLPFFRFTDDPQPGSVEGLNSPAVPPS